MRRAALCPLAARVLAGLGMALFFPVLAGCGTGTGKVSGKVTYKGQPVPGGQVLLRPADPRQNAVSATLDEEGRYSAVLPTGEVTVSIDNRDLEPRPSFGGGIPAGIPLSAEARSKLGKAKAAAPAAPPDKPIESADDPRQPSGRYVPIPEKYYMAETSGLKFTVKGGEQTQDFELTD
jgi:hypothetical protein